MVVTGPTGTKYILPLLQVVKHHRLTASTEEYNNKSANTVTSCSMGQSGGALNQARRIQGNVGGKDAGLAFGGY